MVDVSDPTHPVGVGSIRDGENGADDLMYPNWLDVQGNYVYVASTHSNALQIISLEGLTAPTAKISNLLSTDLVAVRSRVSEFLTVDGGLNVGTNALINGALTIGGTASSSLRTANTNPALVVQSGYVGFGTTTPTARLTVDGSVRFAALAGGTLETDALGNLTVSSDERLKNIVSTSTAGLQAILGLIPIEYSWNEMSGFDQSRQYVGFSAQNVRDYLPEAVGETENGFLTLSLRPILTAVVNAIKEIWDTLTHLTGRVRSLETENELLTERLMQLEDMLGVHAPAREEAQTQEMRTDSTVETPMDMNTVETEAPPTTADDATEEGNTISTEPEEAAPEEPITAEDEDSLAPNPSEPGAGERATGDLSEAEPDTPPSP
jgi:hypothetical protein